MWDTQKSLFELYDHLISDSEIKTKDRLDSWLKFENSEAEWFRSYARKCSSSIPKYKPEDSGRLYALSRINDLLLLRFQKSNLNLSSWEGPELTLDEYVGFFQTLGCHCENSDRFFPFFHEIVEVRQTGDDSHAIEVLDFFWPCLMFGNLLFSRAGVIVQGGRSWVRKEIAERSTLYWTHRRKNRPCHDLSFGWGSRSQWRTSFRRDFHHKNSFLWNVDAQGSDQLKEISLEQRAELIQNRSWIRSEFSETEEFFPYNSKIKESVRFDI